MNRKEQAKKAAMARSKPTPTRPGAAAQAGARLMARGNQFAFFTEESQGLKLSPKTVLILSLLYMGIVVLLHIFGKVKVGTAVAAGGKDL
jgi:protein transport protein SEC61 subunit beta